ncbi:MAG: hypothetical protein HYV09_30345 [Deltaproteobacteria bacterium]|nr:hypothetical protein [Deltaproteobacteria bacterium]
MIVFGTRRFGAVERVPGAVHVATVFVHVMFLPIVPLQSQVVIDGGEHEDRAMVLDSLRWKSVVVAWLRASLVLLALLAFAAAVGLQQRFTEARDLARALSLEEDVAMIVFAAAGAALAVVFAVTYPLTRANADQERALRRISGAG